VDAVNAEEFINKWVEDCNIPEAKKDMKDLYTRLLTIGMKIGGTYEVSSAIAELKEFIEREN
jgi:hypothetical protein